MENVLVDHQIRGTKVKERDFSKHQSIILTSHCRWNWPIWPRSSTFTPLCSTFFPWIGSIDTWRKKPIETMFTWSYFPQNGGYCNACHWVQKQKYTLPEIFSWLWNRGTMIVWPFSFFIGTYKDARLIEILHDITLLCQLCRTYDKDNDDKKIADN